MTVWTTTSRPVAGREKIRGFYTPGASFSLSQPRTAVENSSCWLDDGSFSKKEPQKNFKSSHQHAETHWIIYFKSDSQSCWIVKNIKEYSWSRGWWVMHQVCKGLKCSLCLLPWRSCCSTTINMWAAVFNRERKRERERWRRLTWTTVFDGWKSGSRPVERVLLGGGGQAGGQGCRTA